MQTLVWLIPLLPLLGAAFNGLLGRRLGKTAVHAAALAAVGLSLVLALCAFMTMLGAPGRRLVSHGATWMAAGGLQVAFSLTVDALSGTMMLVVTGIGALIHLYSVAYMEHEAGTARYFAYLNLFVFFMLLLVLGSNLPLLFVGWEGVGLCSYLLIGFHFETEQAPAAGLKAFLANRVGDMGMVLGMLLLFSLFGTLDVQGILGQAAHLAPEAGLGLLTLATLALVFGATGKSAQIPLYLWLPDAMAGPTPVSALIHAATMVTAGIFLVCRLAPVFVLTPITLSAIGWIGGATALFAATIGLFQRDIKKVLAYSTVSQLGYMFLGLGATLSASGVLPTQGFAAGFYHLFTHAWFKALLFLGAGTVIVGMHHEQDLFRMGGLKDKLPLTFWTMLVGTACILGFPGTSGFASKDEILYLAFLRSPWLWLLGLLGACCTAFYMTRLFCLAFLGEPRSEQASHAGEHSRLLTWPLAALAAGALLAVVLGWPRAFGGSQRLEAFLAPALAPGHAAAHGGGEGHGLAWILALASTALSLGSAALAWRLYRKGPAREEALAARFPAAHGLLLDAYRVDAGVEAAVLHPIRWFGNLMWKLVDVIIIDGVGVNFTGCLTRVLGDFACLLQTGRVRSYLLAMVAGLGALLWFFMK